MFVTLNLKFKPVQFLFDVPTQTIKQVLASPLDARVLAMAFAARVLGRGAGTLREWASENPSVRVQAGAQEALRELLAARPAS